MEAWEGHPASPRKQRQQRQESRGGPVPVEMVGIAHQGLATRRRHQQRQQQQRAKHQMAAPVTHEQLEGHCYPLHRVGRLNRRPWQGRNARAAAAAVVIEAQLSSASVWRAQSTGGARVRGALGQPLAHVKSGAVACAKCALQQTLSCAQGTAVIEAHRFGIGCLWLGAQL